MKVRGPFLNNSYFHLSRNYEEGVSGVAGPQKFPNHFIGLHYATPQKTVSSRHAHVSTYTFVAVIII